MKYEIITELTDKNVFNIAHKFTSLRGSEWKPNEIDFLFAFISEIQTDDEQLKFYRLTRAELNKKLNKRIEKARIIKIFRAMLDKKIETETNEEIIHYNIFSTLKYNKENEELSVKFNDDLKPFFLKLKPFTKGYLSDLFKLESAYSKKIYLLCSQWKKAGSFKIKVEQLMNDLQVSKSLKVYADFKRKILKVAQKNMIEKSSIYFEFEEKKKGRKVDEILFKIYQNPKFTKEDQKKLFENEPTIQEQISALQGRNIYIKNKLFFFEDITQKNGKYIIIAKDTENKTISIPTIHITAEATIDTIKEMMKNV